VSLAATELVPGSRSMGAPAAAMTAQPRSDRTPPAIGEPQAQAASKGGKVGWVIGGVVALAAAGAVAFFALAKKPADTASTGAASSAAASARSDKAMVGGASASTAASSSASAAPVACPTGMVEIPGGRFFMGSDKGDEDERPEHNVTLAPYCMDKTEVTVADYVSCSDAGRCRKLRPEVSFPDITPHQKKVYAELCTVGDPQGKANHPINCITWQESADYCKEQGKRLPTEAEWEFAARGPDGRIYPWGDETPDQEHLNACGAECVAWARKVGEDLKPMYPGDDHYPATAPVGSFPKGASRYGLLDVVGNVWEWTSDWAGDYGKDPQTNPTGPSTGKNRIVRGGAFNGAFPSWVRPSQRYQDDPNARSHAYGFRCAKSR
jgi:formylglycine-generating enzyme required for sulfatase activity